MWDLLVTNAQNAVKMLGSIRNFLPLMASVIISLGVFVSYMRSDLYSVELMILMKATGL